MKKALIFQGLLVEVAAAAFQVSPEMQWLDVALDVTPETHEYNGTAMVLKPPLPLPTPLAQIRALEQKHDDDQRKLTRISILELALDKVCANPAMSGKTRAQVHDLYSAASRGYRELFALEVECARLRKLIV